MDQLWAPWRMQYIQGVDDKKDGCIFCIFPQEENDRKNLILFRGKHNFVIMNRFPYNNGHLLIIPYQHLADCARLDDAASLELWKMTLLCKAVLNLKFHPEGFNIGMNLGRAAGAGIDQHIHMHIVPRWNGDTNFMPAVGQVKVISQSLDEAYEQLLPVFSSESANFIGG
jgi:ATP adenylyltransferase